MKVILKSVVASLAVMSLAACSNNDLYDEGVVAANKTAEQQKSYENNFVKTSVLGLLYQSAASRHPCW